MQEAMFPVQKTEDEWAAELTPEQFRVLREHGTERPGSIPLNDEKRAGTFECARCGQPLFDGETKYESCSGWPSFFAPLEGSVENRSTRMPIAAEALPARADLTEFYYAEEYHQRYLAKNPGGYCGLGGIGVSCPVGVTAHA